MKESLSGSFYFHYILDKYRISSNFSTFMSTVSTTCTNDVTNNPK